MTQNRKSGPDPAAHDPSPDATGDREELLGRLRDANERLVLASIREQEHAERAQQHAAQWNAVLESLNEGVIVADAAGAVVLMNAIGRSILGVSEKPTAASAGDPAVLEFRGPDDQLLPEGDRPIERALRGERFTDAEVVLVRPDGDRRWLVFTGSAVRDAAGAIVLGVVVFRDVTELRQLERIKEGYAALIAHDLRTPLTVIQGQADYLRRALAGKGTENAGPHIEAIRRNARRLNAMLQDLTDTAGLETGRFTLHPTPTDLAGLLREVAAEVASPEDQGRLRIEVESALPAVCADAERIKRVLMNLLSNALKYSPPDSRVEVRIERRDDAVVVAITDHGVGIAAEALPRVFERYFRAAGQEVAGLGLGLYIARAIVEASGGRIWAESEPGKGSAFRFSLPIA